MEQFVLGIFQEQLSKFIVGFRKEQINANLLNGKGEIKDVALNCAILNQQLATVTPFVELESVQISRLSFHVTSWTNIRKAPILIDIEDVKATILEPMYYLDRTRRKTLRQVSRAAFIDMLREALYKPRTAPYNLFDRIADNLTIEIRSVQISFQPWGKFKTRRIGPWTPPTLVATLRHIRIASVDEYGHEGSPEEVWSHNHHPVNQPAYDRTLMLYKKISFECDAGVRYPDVVPVPPPLLSQAKVEVHIAVQRRIRDGAILAIQVDATLPKVEIEIPNSMVPTLAHALSGVQYCFAKDRAFEDPLLSKSASAQNAAEIASKIEVSVEIVLDDDEEQDEEDDDDIRLNEISPDAMADEESFDDTVIEESLTPTTSTAAPSPAISRASSIVGGRDHPILMLPNGLVIYDRITMSLSVHHCTIRGTYSPKGDGYVQLVIKGLIAEMIWPKGKEKGGYAQASLSYVSLQERHGPRIRSILIGGILYESNGPVEQPGKAPRGVAADENFPLYENRSLRDDPLDLRHSFPTQAFGLKTTVSFIDKVSNNAEDDVVFTHEVGVDKFDIVLDTDAWSRALRFVLNEDGCGFDQRWHTGDWIDSLSADMLVKSSTPLNLVDHLQPARQLLLDDNELISSDLLNVTAKATNIEIRVPAAIQDDVRSCDIVFKVDETLLLISSALPRTFLTGKIGSSINGDSSGQNGVIDFPNDPTDIVYAMEKTEDPAIRQTGTMTSRVVSTFRLQLTVRGLSARIAPVIPFCDAKEPQQLLAPTEMTMIVCFEGEPPTTPNSNLIKIVFFISVLIHRLHINCDFDLMAGAATTILHHADVVDATVDMALQIFRRVVAEKKPSLGPFIETDGQTKIRRSLHGRRVLVKRQIARSRETGGFSIAFCLQLAELSFQLWRQHIPMSSPLRPSDETNSQRMLDDATIPLIKLVEFNMRDFEVGIEGEFRRSLRRLVVKSCISTCWLDVCDFGSVLRNFAKRNEPRNTEADTKIDVPLEVSQMVDIFCFDGAGLTVKTKDKSGDPNDFLALRFEDCVEQSRSTSLSCDVGSGGVFRIRGWEVESLALLIFEALLMPTWARNRRALANEPAVSLFPRRSVGDILALVACTGIRVFRKGRRVINSSDNVADQNDAISQARSPFKAYWTGIIDRKLALALGRFHVTDFLLSVPNDGSSWLALKLHDFHACVGFNTVGTESAMAKSVAGKGISWQKLLENLKEVNNYMITSRQSLHTASMVEGNAAIQTTIAPEFEFKLISIHGCHDGPTDTQLARHGIEPLLKFLDQASKSSKRFWGLKRSIFDLISVMSTGDEADDVKPQRGTEENSAIKSCQLLLQRIRESIETHTVLWQQALNEKQSQLNSIRYIVFEKEKERIGAIALVSSQVAGWVRVGGFHVSGQRLQSSATLWPHFAVLRNSLLLLFDSEKERKPRDIVSLRGARLRHLRCGKRRDVRRSLAIVESTGVARILTVGSDAEFVAWAQGLCRAIDQHILGSKLSMDRLQREIEANDSDTGSLDHTPSDVKSGVIARRSLQLGKKLISGAVQVAKAKGQAVTQKRLQQGENRRSEILGSQEALGLDLERNDTSTSASVDHSLTSEMLSGAAFVPSSNRAVDGQLIDATIQQPHSNASSAVPPAKSRQIRGRLSVLRNATKNKLGNAVQAAKQKGLEVAEKRLQQWRQHGEDSRQDSIDGVRSSNVHSAQMPERSEATLSSSTSSWSCAACTYINVGHAKACDICGVSRESSSPNIVAPSIATKDVISDSQAVGEEAVNATDIADNGMPASLGKTATDDHDEASLVSDLASEDGEQGQKRRMRDRFGAAVRSVRSLALQKDLASPTTGLSQGIKLRGIEIGKELTSNELCANATPVEIPLKKLEGKWIVHVTSPSTDSTADWTMIRPTETQAVEGKQFPVDISSLAAESPEGMNFSVDSTKDQFKPDFLVQLFKPDAAADLSNSLFSQIQRTVADVFALHSAVSEAVSDYVLFSKLNEPERDSTGFEMGAGLASRLGLSPLDTVRFTGKILAGLLEAPKEHTSLDWERYKCAVVTDFLQSLLSSPLPVNALAALEDFLTLGSVHVENAGMAVSAHISPAESVDGIDGQTKSSDSLFVDRKYETLLTDSARDILSLSAVCQTELHRIERDGQLVINGVSSPSSATRQIESPHMRRTVLPTIQEPLLPSSVLENLHEAMHAALMKVMAERDEAHAQLIAASVLHVHEMEQERKKLDHLTKQLEVVQKQLKAANGGPLANFGSEDNKSETNLKRFQDQMTQNVEAELLSLCQQLAGEISARTAAELEIIRLKESRKLERDSELAEKQALRNELKRAKESRISEDESNERG